MASLILRPIQNHLLITSAAEALYLAKTTQSDLFRKNKVKIDPNNFRASLTPLPQDGDENNDGQNLSIMNLLKHQSFSGTLESPEKKIFDSEKIDVSTLKVINFSSFQSLQLFFFQFPCCPKSCQSLSKSQKKLSRIYKKSKKDAFQDLDIISILSKLSNVPKNKLELIDLSSDDSININRNNDQIKEFSTQKDEKN